MKHLAKLVPYRALRIRKPLAHLKPWRLSPELRPRLKALLPNVDKLPEHLRDYADNLLAEAITYGLNEERRIEIDKLIEEVKRRR